LPFATRDNVFFCGFSFRHSGYAVNNVEQYSLRMAP
jgi:hypothetical protein